MRQAVTEAVQAEVAVRVGPLVKTEYGNAE